MSWSTGDWICSVLDEERSIGTRVSNTSPNGFAAPAQFPHCCQDVATRLLQA